MGDRNAKGDVLRERHSSSRRLDRRAVAARSGARARARARACTYARLEPRREVRARVYRPRVRRRASTGEKRKSAENLRVVIFADKEDVAIVKCKTNIFKYGLPN